MFETWFPAHWTTLKKLIWLRITALGNAIKTVTGAIVTFTCKSAKPIVNLTATLSPIQDLHGYDAPWPAGGGANKWDEEWEVGGINSSTGANVNQSGTIRSTNYIPVTPDTEYYFYVGKADIGAPIFLFYYASDKSYLGSSGEYKYVGAQTTPNNCYYVRFQLRQGYGATYLNDVAINYPSSVTTYSPYSNLCPISGHTGVTVTRTGKNLCDISEFVRGTFDNSGNEATSTTRLRSPFIRVDGGETIVYNSNLVVHETFYFDANKAFISKNAPGLSPYTKELPANAAYTRFSVRKSDNSTVTLSDLTQVLLAYGTDADFEPFNGNTYPITFPNTVYGGEGDVVSGEWSNGLAKITIDGNTASNGSAVAGSNWRRIYNRSDGLKTAGQTESLLAENAKVDSSAYGSPASCTMLTICKGSQTTSYSLYVVIPNCASNDDATAYLNQNPITLTYPLATPVPFTTTPAPITTLKGQNNVWVDDSGEIEVTYYE